MSGEREFDLIVFGATGFTGQFVVEEVARTADTTIKWAIAGRSLKKLEQVLTTASEIVGKDIKSVTKIEADISDDESLIAMTRRTRLILNCVGPYRFFGEQMIKACIETSTNHIDISGEPQYMESIQVKYNKVAEEKGIYIISACGWDSIPSDLGVQFLKKNFNGELNAVETYMAIKVGPNGHKTNYGTWHSAIYGFAHASELRSIRRRLYSEVFTKRMPKSKYPLQRKNLPFRSDVTNSWALQFPGSDRSVIQRTQQFQYENYNERPTQIQTYFTLPSFITVIGTIFVATIFAMFASFKCGRSLLEKYPKFFSFGLFDRVGPTREQINAAKFQLLIVGKGWDEKLTEPTDEPTVPYNKTLVVKVKGLDPGYLATSTCLVQAGLTILYESDKMPKRGGVLTPGSAFESTNIYERLAKQNLTFEVLSN